MFSSWGDSAQKRKARYGMATSSITANFYTDDPKAANNIVRALFTNVKPSPLPRQKVEIVEFKTAAERIAFARKVARRARECQRA